MTKQDLTAAIAIKRKLTRFEARLSDLEATGGIRTSLGHIGGCGQKGSAADLAVELADEITKLQRDLEVEQEIIRRALEKMELDETERKLMIYRYVDCREWKEVSERIAYSIQQTFRMHAAIIEKAGIKDESP